MTAPRFGRVVTFYSFKGGVGRTQALADVAVLLARYGHRVLMVDWDLEAPGLESYFRPWLPTSDADGLLELVSAFTERTPESAARQHEILALPGLEDRLGLLRAGRHDASHDQRVQALDWNGLYQQGFGRWLEDVRSAWQRDWDFILVDSRTGINDIGAICTMQLPEILILLFTPNEQSVVGAERAAKAAVQGQRGLPLDRAPLRVVPVLTRVESSERLLQQQWLKASIERFTPWIDDWSDAPGRAADLMARLLVPYVPYWSYGEQVPVLQTGIQAGVEQAHESLALLLHHGLADVGSLLEDRARLVADAESSVRFKYDVFVSYPHRHAALATRMVDALRARGLRVAWDGDLPLGASWAADLRAMAADARHSLFVLDEEFSPSQLIEVARFTEWQRAEPRTRWAIPILLADTPWSKVPYDLASVQGLRLSPAQDVDDLADQISASLQREL